MYWLIDRLMTIMCIVVLANQTEASAQRGLFLVSSSYQLLGRTHPWAASLPFSLLSSHSGWKIPEYTEGSVKWVTNSWNIAQPPELFLPASPQDATTLPLLPNLFHTPLPHSQLVSPGIIRHWAKGLFAAKKKKSHHYWTLLAPTFSLILAVWPKQIHFKFIVSKEPTSTMQSKPRLEVSWK